jgi:hypothetical protein
MVLIGCRKCRYLVDDLCFTGAKFSLSGLSNIYKVLMLEFLPLARIFSSNLYYLPKVLNIR